MKYVVIIILKFSMTTSQIYNKIFFLQNVYIYILNSSKGFKADYRNKCNIKRFLHPKCKTGLKQK